MSRQIRSTNPLLRRLLRLLRTEGRKNRAKIWLDLAGRLEGSRRSRAEVNLSSLDRYTTDGNTVVVPGKILAAGRLNHPVNVAAFKFSAAARRKVIAAGGSAFTLNQLLEQNPSGKDLKLME